MRPVSILVALFLLVSVGASQVLAIEAGGEAEALYSGVLSEDRDFEAEFIDRVDLELFLPAIGNTEFSYAFQISKPLQSLSGHEKAVYFPKKFYLKHKFESINSKKSTSP